MVDTLRSMADPLQYGKSCSCGGSCNWTFLCASAVQPCARMGCRHPLECPCWLDRNRIGRPFRREKRQNVRRFKKEGSPGTADNCEIWWPFIPSGACAPERDTSPLLAD